MRYGFIDCSFHKEKLARQSNSILISSHFVITVDDAAAVDTVVDFDVIDCTHHYYNYIDYYSWTSDVAHTVI